MSRQQRGRHATMPSDECFIEVGLGQPARAVELGSGIRYSGAAVASVIDDEAATFPPVCRECAGTHKPDLTHLSLSSGGACSPRRPTQAAAAHRISAAARVSVGFALAINMVAQCARQDVAR
jgi:hypothetical protein